MDKFPFPWWVIAAVIACAIVSILIKGFTQSAPRSSPRARPILTKSEERMFFALQQALPEFIVLAQVSFQALLVFPGNRNKISQKYADFVLCNPDLSVHVIIELDGSSHDSTQGKDIVRQAILEDAGYTVIRFRAKELPPVNQLKATVEAKINALPAWRRKNTPSKK